MKLLSFLLAALFLLSSCHMIRGSGNIITEKRATGEFNGISAGGDFEVEFTNGPVTEVIVEADDNIMSYIETRVSGGILKIRTRDLNSYSNVHMKILISAPLISDVKVSASAIFLAKDLMKCKGELTFNASSAASITAEVDAPVVETNASSGATISIAGKTKTHTAESSSGASLKTADLLSEVTEVKASSGATAKVHASIKIIAKASSGATIHYFGGASVDKTVSSGGTVVKGD